MSGVEYETPARVLAIYAHPDDPEISAGGTLARWAAAGAEVHSLVTTRGDKGTTDPDVDTEALVARARAGSRGGRARARRRVGVTSTIPTASSPTTRAPRGELVRYVRTVRPDVVCAPTRRRCSSATATSTIAITASRAGRRSTRSRPRPGNPHYFPELRAEGLDVHQPRAVYLSGTLEPNVWIDIADTLDRKIEALFCHASQLVETGDWFRAVPARHRRGGGPRRGRHVRGGFRRIAVGLTSPGLGSGPVALTGGYGGGVRAPFRLGAQHRARRRRPRRSRRSPRRRRHRRAAARSHDCVLGLVAGTASSSCSATVGVSVHVVSTRP